MSGTDDWKKKKVAVYIRRSKGESGDTEEQLKRIEPMIKALEKSGKIAKVNRGLVGRQFNYTKEEGRFKSSRDLARKGDIYNEGDGQSAFDSSRERVVLNEMLKRMRKGQYDAVIAETLDRYSRDPLDFATVALDDWRKGGKQFASLKESYAYGSDDPLDESIITTQLMWGGEGKKSESGKSRDALESKIDVGYISKPKAELRGSKSAGAGRDYRQVWARMLTYGETPEGRLRKPGEVGKSFKRDHTWASNFYELFSQWNAYVYPDGETALEKWFDAVDAINQFIAEYPMRYDAQSFKADEVKQLIKSSNGFLAYPAGINPSTKYPIAQHQFILFPNPTDFDLNQLSITPDPQTIAGWMVQREPLGNRKLMKHQTQFRGAGGKGKKLV